MQVLLWRRVFWDLSWIGSFRFPIQPDLSGFSNYCLVVPSTCKLFEYWAKRYFDVDALGGKVFVGERVVEMLKATSTSCAWRWASCTASYVRPHWSGGKGLRRAREDSH